MRIGFIGAGQMARALATGLIERGLTGASEIIASDCVAASRDGFLTAVPLAHATDQNDQVASQSEVLFLAVKPQHAPNVFAELHSKCADCLVISIVAGMTLQRLVDGLGTDRVVRVMPNTPCLIGEGASGFCRAKGVSDSDVECTERLLRAVGACWELPESLLDAVTGLSGSGPAFVYLFIEALSDGGVRMGLPRDVALQLAARTVSGAAQMVLQSGDHPAVLKDRVSSPGGTTIAGIQALETAGFRAAAMHAVQAATQRSKELGMG